MSGKSRKNKKKRKQQDLRARRRAEIIMKVRGGVMTATEGAAALGVSRKTYYKWENRALKGMLEGLEDQEVGRPVLPVPDEEELELRRKLEELEKEKQLLEQKMELKDLVHELELEQLKKEEAEKEKSRTKKK